MQKNLRRLNIVCVISIIFFFSGFQYSIAYENEIENLSTVMTVNIASAGKKIVAVVDFTDLQGNVTELGRFLAEEFSIAIAGADKGFMVVDRTHLKSIIEEHKLSSTGLIDPQTARKLGKIAGVDALITGTITPFGDSIRLAVKVLDTETAKMISASSGNIAKTQAIEELLAKSVETENSNIRERKSSSRISKSKTNISASADGFKFDWQKCKRSGNSVTLYFLVTNNEKYRDLEIRRYSRFFDDLGNEYSAKSIQLGNDVSSKSYPDVRKKLPTGIPVKASITFENVSPQANMIELFEIDTKKSNVHIRNIPLSK